MNERHVCERGPEEARLRALEGYLRAHGAYGFASIAEPGTLHVLSVWTKDGRVGETWEEAERMLRMGGLQ